MTNATVSHYEVTNTKTGVTKSYKTRATATAAANRADNAYGAYICRTRAIWAGA